MTRGRPPIPPKLHLVRGSFNTTRHQKKLDRPVEAEGDLRGPPDWFSDEQKADWSYCVDHAPRDLLKRIDFALLTTFIVAQDLHRKAAAKLAKESWRALVLRTDKGYQLNPLTSLISRQAEIMRKAASEMGFTPVSRVRASGMGPGGESEDAIERKYFS